MKVWYESDDESNATSCSSEAVESTCRDLALRDRSVYGLFHRPLTQTFNVRDDVGVVAQFTVDMGTERCEVLERMVGALQ